jgi:hypothetical protein
MTIHPPFLFIQTIHSAFIEISDEPPSTCHNKISDNFHFQQQGEMFDTLGKIAIAQLVFFVIAFLPAHYVLFKHGLRGILGWLFITVCGFDVVCPSTPLLTQNHSSSAPFESLALPSSFMMNPETSLSVRPA